jgi:hypothetical protein
MNRLLRRNIITIFILKHLVGQAAVSSNELPFAAKSKESASNLPPQVSPQG